MNVSTKLFESIYLQNTIYYHGNCNLTETLILGDKNYKGKGLYITSSPTYACAYTLISAKSAKFNAERKGFIYSIKLKKDVNLFNASDPKDVAKLNEYISSITKLDDKDIDSLKNEDWWFFSKRKPEPCKDRAIWWDKDDIVKWVKEAGFDGFYNNEDWRIWIEKDDDDSVLYHSIGPGLMIFDTKNLEIVNKEDNKTFMKNHNITPDDVIKIDEEYEEYLE